VVRGNLADRDLIAFWHRDGVVTAAMNVNVWDVIETSRPSWPAGAVEPNRLSDPPCLSQSRGLGVRRVGLE
jgi:3-phenylpropionate/trans-cinnamate dioxygenase ferredoxin reductase subunit